jgi:hypothetical protein
MITGKFIADFTDFDRGVQGAIPKLQTFQAAADKAGGRLMDLGQKGQDATPKIGGLAGSLRTFDGALASMGVHIGPEIKALGELGEASGKTASQLGLVTTAGLALAAGIGGWKIGRLIAEFTGSDKAIGDWVAHAMGWGDELERAGAKADVLARASKTAGHEITSFAEAMKINADAAADFQLKMGRSANAARDTAIAISGWQREIRDVRKNGDFEALTADLESQNFTIKDLSVKYGIHAEALQYLTRQTKAAADVQQQANDARKKAAAEVAAAEKEAIAFTATRWKQQLDMEVKILESTAKQTAGYLALTNEGVLKELAAQQELTKGVDVAVTAFTRLEAAQKALQATKMAGFPIAAQEAVLMKTFARQAGNAELGKVPPVAKAAGGSINDLADTFNRAAGVIVGGLTSVAAAPRHMQPGQNPMETQAEFTRRRVTESIPHFGVGGPVMQDGPIYAHAGEYVVPKGGGGGGITVNVYGNVLSTKAELARLVKEALATTHMAGGGRMPA